MPERPENIGVVCKLDSRPCVHFVGFRGEEYLSAVRVWGLPDYWHRGWDRRARREIDFDRDTIVFAFGPHDQGPRTKSFDDIREPARSGMED